MAEDNASALPVIAVPLQEPSLTPVAKAPAGEGEPPATSPVEVTPETAFSTLDNSASASPNGKNNADNLRRTSSKIANLRAAFESTSNGTNSLETPIKKRYERSPSRPHEYETEIARLKDQLEKEAELRQAYEEKCAVLEEANDAVTARLEHRDKVWESEIQREHGSLLKEKIQAVEEANSFQRQLAELKRSISSATHIDNHVTDTTFTSELGILHSEIQNWTVQNFRRAKLGASSEETDARIKSIEEPQERELLSQLFLKQSPTSKLACIQTAIVSSMMEIFRHPLLFGMESQEVWQQSVKTAIEKLPDVLTPPAFNKWRAMTLNSLRQCDSMKSSIDATAVAVADKICVMLGKLTDAEEHEARVASLNSIIKRSIDLAHLFKAQRAQYDFVLPGPGTNFDTETMEDIADEKDDLNETAIVCATFPSVVKTGDENGDNTRLTNVIFKAKVLRSDTEQQSS
ncbi:uncharacterized protein K489DRAFT_111644 [Dissoconium aciculare CBS 342.82]|uniref:Uncharacterized protein n=1 Tax=Dissoconium aciculare CBS 342.82 TaxID=1314786 RepID=A0A6J3ME55_9PEZI|nr:uncharacterized protein K489DRAFT_111644 [Dissoconium aciculare CBS 342.82]KAF1826290.1 hypothetical protein K489DRAFT_111644 [Dissoconium aciculare CBS 342.82]